MAEYTISLDHYIQLHDTSILAKKSRNMVTAIAGKMVSSLSSSWKAVIL
jgi:hypothetical protein